MKTIVIYPSFNASYYSFYIQGLIDTFGESNIQFSSREFPQLPSEWLSFIYKGERELRFAIDAYDGQITIPQYAALDWCDVYGKVNLRSHIVFKEYLQKCLAIGPSFGIRTWSPSKSLWLALRNYHPGIEGMAGAREHFGNYWRQCKYRLGLNHFAPGPSQENYIFCMSSLWDEIEAPRTNGFRAAFMRCCKSLEGVTFEGGFSPSASSDRTARYKEHIAARHYPYTEWVEKTKRSTLVFNNPAVWQCHGWKLAEYLALGKAIISTPPVNDLPSALVHGQHVHYVDGSEDSFRDAILTILKDHDYRKHLEKNAHDYYETYLSPHRVIERLFAYGRQTAENRVSQ